MWKDRDPPPDLLRLFAALTFAQPSCYAADMTRGEEMRRDALRRYFVFRMKLVELFHLHLLFTALADEKFIPENVMGHEGRNFAETVRTALLSWYCTIVDRTKGGLDVFNVWRELFPNHRDEIEQLRVKVEPDWEVLKTFRDKCGFHADTPRAYFLARQKVLENIQVVNSMQDFLDLAKKLIQLEDTELTDFVPEVEAFLLDFELEPGNPSVNRNAMRKLLILPHGNYKKVFG